MDSNVFRPIMTGQPDVVRLKNFKSSEICHRRALSLPMALLSAIATIMHFSIIKQLPVQEYEDMDRNPQARSLHT